MSADPGVSEGRAQPALTHTEKMALDAWLFDPEYPGFNLVAVAAIVKKIAYPPSGLSLGEPAREELQSVIRTALGQIAFSDSRDRSAHRLADAVLSWFGARQQQQQPDKVYVKIPPAMPLADEFLIVGGVIQSMWRDGVLVYQSGQQQQTQKEEA